MPRETLTQEQTKTIADLERILGERVEELKTKLQTETDEFIRGKVQELEASVQASNEKAKQHLEDVLKQAQTIRNDRLREIRVQFAENMYRGALEFSLNLLENFRQQYSL